jgi:hypothetical protein
MQRPSTLAMLERCTVAATVFVLAVLAGRRRGR